MAGGGARLPLQLGRLPAEHLARVHQAQSRVGSDFGGGGVVNGGWLGSGGAG